VQVQQQVQEQQQEQQQVQVQVQEQMQMQMQMQKQEQVQVQVQVQEQVQEQEQVQVQEQGQEQEQEQKQEQEQQQKPIRGFFTAFRMTASFGGEAMEVLLSGWSDPRLIWGILVLLKNVSECCRKTYLDVVREVSGWAGALVVCARDLL
jgi:hypothetical protein